MKKIIYTCMTFACAMALASCGKDDSEIAQNSQLTQEQGNVSIVLNTGDMNFSPSSRALGDLAQNGFNIRAYRQGDSNNNYYYYKNLDVSKFSYDPATKFLTGTLNLDYGTYKFLPSYGLANSGNFNWPNFENKAILTDDLYLQYSFGALNEIFLDTTPAADLTPFVLNLNDASANVYATTLKRAVGRVDIQFISADTTSTGDIVLADRDVTGGMATGSLKLTLDGVSPQMSMNGIVPEQSSDNNLVKSTYTFSNLMNIVIKGENPSDNTIGTSTFNNNYNQIDASYLKSGSVYYPGPYFFPQYEPEGTSDDSAYRKAKATIEIQNTASIASQRIITLEDPIPVRRNRVTVIKIYVLSDHIYSTAAKFKIEVDTVWEGGQSVEGIIK